MTIHIIYDNYLKPDGSEMSIGGIQTYLHEIINIIQDLGINVVVHQRANMDFIKDVSTCTVHGYKLDINRNMRKKLVHKALEFIDQNRDIVLFGCETNAVVKLKCKTIGIQHGIFWDKPGNINASAIQDVIVFLKKTIKAYQTTQRICNIDELVCVDYNFVNWYRALVNYPKAKLHVFPNFCKVPEKPYDKPSECINIIFARRFFPYRGTRIFEEAIRRIVDEYPQVNVTVAGSGPDEDFLKSHLKGDQFTFITYSSEDSLSIHKDKHIALVPTLGSEGTSLSLLEAMAAGCAPICTNVGGMTNIIIDRYNGLMINTNAKELYEAMKCMIEDVELRRNMSAEAYKTAKLGFNYTKWKSSWLKLLGEMINK